MRLHAPPLPGQKRPSVLSPFGLIQAGGGGWWRLHTPTFAVYLLATLHGLGTGTDTQQPRARALYAGSALLVGALLLTRLLTPIGPRGRAHPRLAALTAVVLVGGIAWAVTGPAHAGWSAMASHVL